MRGHAAKITNVQLTFDSLSEMMTEVQGANPLATEAKTVTCDGFRRRTLFSASRTPDLALT